MFCFNFRCFRLFDYIIAAEELYRNALCNSVLYKNYSFYSNPVRIAHIKAQTFEHLAEYQFHSEKHHKTGGNSYPILSCEYARAHIFAKIRKGTFREKTRGIFRLRSEPNLPAQQGHKWVETAGVYPLAPAAGRGNSPSLNLSEKRPAR